jgi:hypothetical protein
MWSLIRHGASFVLAVMSLRGIRWAYVAFVVLALVYFPASVDFDLRPRACELTFDARLAAFSLTNYAHIILFALFFLLSNAHAAATGRPPRAALAFAAVATFTMRALVELTEGVTGAATVACETSFPIRPALCSPQRR